jgi:hypothetical protein
MTAADDALGDLDDGSFAAASRDTAGDLTAVVDRHLGPPIRPTRDVVLRVVHR